MNRKSFLGARGTTLSFPAWTMKACLFPRAGDCGSATSRGPISGIVGAALRGPRGGGPDAGEIAVNVSRRRSVRPPQIGMLPLLASAFHRITFAGTFLNFAAVPLTAIIVPLGFCPLIIGFLWPV